MEALTDEPALWGRYRRQGDREAQQLLFARYAPWARATARDVYRRVRILQVEWTDYAQNAMIGLLEAISRYDPERGVDFMAYAKPRVRGAVFNGLRSYLNESAPRQSWDARQRDRYESLQDAGEDDLLTQLVSTVSGLAVGYLFDLESAPAFSSGSESVERQLDKRNVSSTLREAVKLLPEREELVLRLHYFQHVPFVEIAKLLGLTKGRISQIHKAGITRLRSHVHSVDWADYA
jgi:RNA polymerase sigma factor for flagellar operon FliA